MPAAPRSSKEATKIVESILGKPPAKLDNKTAEQKRIDEILEVQQFTPSVWSSNY